jgi:hypothetical protein
VVADQSQPALLLRRERLARAHPRHRPVHPAAGTNTDLMQAFSALPNVLMAGSGITTERPHRDGRGGDEEAQRRGSRVRGRQGHGAPDRDGDAQPGRDDQRGQPRRTPVVRIILNTEWSPETTLQAEDRCHRPGQTKDVHVHYILSAGMVDEHMWELIDAKAAAQRVVFDKEAVYKSVEQVMAEAVGTQMQVAQAVVTVEREPLSELEMTVESAPSCEHIPPQRPAGQLTMADLFQRHSAQPTGLGGRRSQPVEAQQLSLFGLGQGQPLCSNKR